MNFDSFDPFLGQPAGEACNIAGSMLQVGPRGARVVLPVGDGTMAVGEGLTVDEAAEVALAALRVARKRKEVH